MRQNGERWRTSRALVDYTWQRHYPEIEDSPDRYLNLLREVMKRQALLISKWMLVGFIHGVMNTDNMSISGETIDYGPCAFMDDYNLETVFSSIDVQGRYAYGNQPNIGGWNLARFAETLLPLLDEDEKKAIDIAEEAISDFPKWYRRNWLEGMRSKLGLFNEEEQDERLIEGLFHLMQKYRADYTNTFRSLTLGKPKEMVLYGKKPFDEWYEQWQARIGRQKESKDDSLQLMRNSNPAVIPRNHRVEEALEAAVDEDDFSVMERLLVVLSKPFAYSPDQEEYCKLPESSAQPYRTFCGT